MNDVQRVLCTLETLNPRKEEPQMASPISKEALDTIFLEARTHTAWLPRPVDDATLKKLYDIFKMGPTSANTLTGACCLCEINGSEGKIKARSRPGNVDKTMAAPVCAIVATDTRFYENIPVLWPHNPEMANYFTAPGSEEKNQDPRFAERHAPGGLSHHRCPRDRPGYRPDVRL